MRTKLNEWWCIKPPADWKCKIGIRPFECGRTKELAIKNFVAEANKNWSKLYKAGYRCVKATINEVKV